jgi:GNAT superfamily N-acetyltransferase
LRNALTVGLRPASAADLPALMDLFCDARAWHAAKGVDVWSSFDPALIARDVAQRRIHVAHYEGTVCGTVTLLDSDPLVWGGDDKEALYVHRLATARSLAGKGIGAQILRWAAEFARARGKRFLRLETWDGNRGMRRYYEQQGFRHVEDRYFPLDSPLPDDYRGTHKSLYELELI